MTPSDSNPKLPMWMFFATDAALIGAAAVIAYEGGNPLTTNAILAIVACVIAGAIVALVPLVVHFERQKNEALDDRQRALEGLARTVASSAEQISIAANGLHEIAELAQKNLRHAEQLPHKLQDKIAEFQSQLANTNDAEKEELEKEVVSLRTAESERLETVAARIAKAVADFSKLEAVTQQQLAAANEAVAKLSFGTAAAIGKAQVAAEQALAQARNEAARGLGETAGNATRTIESARAHLLAEIDARLVAAGEAFVERVSRELVAKLQATVAHGTMSGSFDAPIAKSEAPTSNASAAGTSETDAPDENPSPKAESTAHPPKRPRKPRRDDPTSGEAAVADALASANPAQATEGSKPMHADEPLPIPSVKITEITPIVPPTAEPFSGHIISNPSPGQSASTHPPVATGSPLAQVATSASAQSEERRSETTRKRAGKKPSDAGSSSVADIEPGPAADESTSGAGIIERVLTSDGATRLIVTAYIGIGNRLFIRGTGPGLSWEKGVPLQFVSIGKWRWETNDATAPVRFKIYKNDDLECTALGPRSIDPGFQQEVAATF